MGQGVIPGPPRDHDPQRVAATAPGASRPVLLDGWLVEATGRWEVSGDDPRALLLVRNLECHRGPLVRLRWTECDVGATTLAADRPGGFVRLPGSWSGSSRRSRTCMRWTGGSRASMLRGNSSRSSASRVRPRSAACGGWYQRRVATRSVAAHRAGARGPCCRAGDPCSTERLIRPLAVTLGLLESGAAPVERRLIARFSIHVIGTVHYLVNAVDHG